MNDNMEDIFNEDSLQKSNDNQDTFSEEDIQNNANSDDIFDEGASQNQNNNVETFNNDEGNGYDNTMSSIKKEYIGRSIATTAAQGHDANDGCWWEPVETCLDSFEYHGRLYAGCVTLGSHDK